MMITRFAPSPTGPLHLGHAYSALIACDMAHAAGGSFLLRIEDIDQSRARSTWEEQIYDDLAWLGITWDTPVLRQSEQSDRYQAALRELHAKGLIYPCFCSRKDIKAAASAPQEGAPVLGPDGIIYPQTCAGLAQSEFDPTLAYRLSIARCFEYLGKEETTFEEQGSGPRGDTGEQRVSMVDMCNYVGDVVVSRKDMGTSYHLSVVLDDADQSVTHVTRGQDLFEATQIHVLLQQVLGLSTPMYYHHALIRDEHGKRLAKRDDARALSKYRAEGNSPADIRRMVGL